MSVPTKLVTVVRTPAILGFALALGCAGSGAAAGGESGNAVGGGPDRAEASAMIQQELRLTLSAGDAPVPASAPITLELSIDNTGDTVLDLDFPDGQRYDFRVLAADGSVAWHWAEGMFFTMMLGRETLEPGGSLRWSETIADGLPAGTYRVVGTLTTVERNTVEITLTVEG